MDNRTDILDPHPAVKDLFPPPSPADRLALTLDIKIHGQREPILVYEGKIVDGITRYGICKELERDPIIVEWPGTATPEDLIKVAFSRNFARRQLSAGQKAMIAIDFLEKFNRDAKARRTAGLKQYQDGASGPERIPERGDAGMLRGDVRELLADLVGTNGKYIDDAKRLASQAPDLAANVKAGNLGIPAAMRIFKQRPEYIGSARNAVPDRSTDASQQPKALAAATSHIPARAASDGIAPLGQFVQAIMIITAITPETIAAAGFVTEARRLLRSLASWLELAQRTVADDEVAA